MARITDITRVGAGRYRVMAEASGNQYRYDLTGGLLTREDKYSTAALTATYVSDLSLRTSAMIRLMMEGREHDKDHEDIVQAWNEQAIALDILSMMVPNEIRGLSTGSQGGEWAAIESIFRNCEKIRSFLIESAPATWRGGEAGFKERWSSYVFQKDFSTSVMHIVQKQMDRSGNVPALVARSPTAPSLMRAWAMNQATKHIPDLVPLREEAPRVIRGDRAASLLNVIVPRIEAQIGQIEDPQEQAALRSRLERLGDKVEIAAANRSRDRLRQDVMLSIETLEEQIDARLPDFPQPTPDGIRGP